MGLSYIAGAAKQGGGESFVEPGDYALLIINATDTTSKSGKYMMKLELQVLKQNGERGPKLFDYLIPVEVTQWKIDQFLKSCGKHPGEGNPVNFETSDLIGLECAARLKVEVYDGRKSNKVDHYIFDDEEAF